MKTNNIVRSSVVLAFFSLSLSRVCAQNTTIDSDAEDDEMEVAPLSYFGGGTAGVTMNDWYYSISARLQQNATDHICFVDTVLPPDFAEQLRAQLCPSGPMSLAECKAECDVIGLPSLVSCPFNLAGCCECPFFSFHNNNEDAGDIHNFANDNVFWGILPGWLNLAVWSMLFCALLFLVFSIQQEGSARCHELRQHVIVVSRVTSIAGLILFAMWMIIYLIAMNGVGYQNYYAFAITAVGIFSHVFGSSIWSITGALQFVGPIRQRWPRAHRILGWICVFSGVLSTIGLLILIFGPHNSSLGGTVISLIFTVYWNVALGLAVRSILVKRDVESHRRWMTRHMFVGASVILQRIFNVLNSYLFKDPSYYVGTFFYEAACEDPSSIHTVSIESTSPAGEESQIFLNGSQITFACTGISVLFDAYTFTFQFAAVFVLVGIFGCELWLWACGLQASQQSIALADAAFSIPPSKGGVKLSILRLMKEETVVTLAEKERIAEDAFRLRFRFANEKETLLVPHMGHVNLRREGMLRPRPYSPVHSLEPGHITFYIRHKPGGLLSSYLTQSMNVGDTILLSGPSAQFGGPFLSYPSIGTTKNLIVIAGGTGIAPFLSLLETTDAHCRVLVRDKSEERAILHASNASYCKDKIQVENFDDNGKFRDRLDSLRVDIDKAKEDCKPDLILICGPSRFNVAVKSTVGRYGIPCFAVGTDDR